MSKNCAPETFRTPRQGPCFSFAGAKVQQFRKPPKHINNFFQKNCIHNTPYIILIYAREEFRLSKKTTTTSVTPSFEK